MALIGYTVTVIRAARLIPENWNRTSGCRATYLCDCGVRRDARSNIP
jgi:hypothetical protein